MHDDAIYINDIGKECTSEAIVNLADEVKFDWQYLALSMLRAKKLNDILLNPLHRPLFGVATFRNDYKPRRHTEQAIFYSWRSSVDTYGNGNALYKARKPSKAYARRNAADASPTQNELKVSHF